MASGKHDGEFPVDTYQTGSGTSSNMNMNEVLANLATSILGSAVHPNDHANASQSSNDVFPTSVHIAVTQALIDTLIPSLGDLLLSARGFRGATAAAASALPASWHTLGESGRLLSLPAAGRAVGTPA